MNNCALLFSSFTHSLPAKHVLPKVMTPTPILHLTVRVKKRMKFVAETLLWTMQIFLSVNIEKKNRGVNAKNSVIWFETGMERAGREAGTS